MKKKILLMLTDSYPFGLAENYVKNEIEYLSKYFKEVFIFSRTLNSGESLYKLPENVRAFSLSGRLLLTDKILSYRYLISKIFWDEVKYLSHYQLHMRWSILKIMLAELKKAHKCMSVLKQFLTDHNLKEEDIVAYSYWTDSRALASAWLRNKKITAISRAHGWDVYFERHPILYQPFRKYLHDHLNAIYFVSKDGRDYSLKRIPGTNTTKFRVSNLGTPFIGRNPDTLSNEFIVVSCARLVSLKRVHLIAEIISRIKLFPVRWIHFGDGPLQDELLKKTFTLFSGHANIHFDFRGDTSIDEINNYYLQNHVDLFLLTSAYEGKPVVIMEALSFGIPVMATNAGGIKEMVNESNGFLLNLDFRPEEAAKKIECFYNMTDKEKENFRSNAFLTWKQSFNADVNYPLFVEEILSLGKKD
ncbi:MAG: glycosyltransferase [Chitinophagales bacterium]|nr:glycosyltransferase [Chitinophagales bacterium]